MENALWFILGYILSRVFAGIHKATKGLLLFKQSEIDCLKMLAISAEHSAYAQEVRKILVKSPDLPIEILNVLKVQINLHDYVVESWKRSSIENLIQSYPLKRRRHIGYNDWESAMEYLDTVKGYAVAKRKQNN